MKQSSAETIEPTPASFGERMKFVIWLAGATVGVDSAAGLAAIAGKSPSQLSNWVNEKPRPNYENIRLLADLVGVSASWLDDPTSKDAREPKEWLTWWTPRAKAKQEAQTTKAKRRGGS